MSKIDGYNNVGTHPFGYKGEEGTCLHCGRKLRKYKYDFLGPNRRGDYGDNAFCGIRCGYAFGLRLATLGQRLTSAKGR